MELLIRDRDEAAAIEAAANGIGRWEFIASGTTSQSPYHQWRCAFYLGRSQNGQAAALQLRDFGDPDEEYEDDEPFVETVAVARDTDGRDVSEVVRTLLTAYRGAGGKYIEEFDELGDFDLKLERVCR
jgi:hypothetical protein